MKNDEVFRDLLIILTLAGVYLSLILSLDGLDKIREDLANIGAASPPIGCEVVNTFFLPDTTKILVTMTCPIKETENEESN